jgi:hypothetical protein
VGAGIAWASVDGHGLAVVWWLAGTLEKAPVAALGYDGEAGALSCPKRLLYVLFRMLGSQGSASCWIYPTDRLVIENLESRDGQNLD